MREYNKFAQNSRLLSTQTIRYPVNILLLFFYFRKNGGLVFEIKAIMLFSTFSFFKDGLSDEIHQAVK